MKPNMKITKYVCLCAVLAAMTATSCRKTEAEILNPSKQLEYRLPSEQFTAIWNSMNTSYAMWDIESTDWTSVKDKYMPEFLALDDSVKADYPISTQHLKQLYTDILGKLKDHHSAFFINNLWADEYDLNQIQIVPGDLEISERDYFHERHIRSSIINWCLSDEDYANFYGIHSWTDLTMVAWLRKMEAEGRATDIKYGSVTGEITIVSGLIDGNIPYIHISDFSLTSLFEEAKQEYTTSDVKETMEAYESFKDNVLNLPEVKGVIVDVRENGGGFLNDQFYLLGLLIDEPVQMGWSRHKTGLGRYDYSPWIPHVFSPGPEHRKVEGPVVIISDLYSVSMSEISTMMVKAMPNGCFIGERTFGGHGVINGDFEEHYSGTFGDRNGNHYAYLSTRIVKDYNGDILEGIGVTPDIEMPYSADDFKDGKDSWLSRAVEYINNPVR